MLKLTKNIVAGLLVVVGVAAITAPAQASIYRYSYFYNTRVVVPTYSTYQTYSTYTVPQVRVVPTYSSYTYTNVHRVYVVPQTHHYVAPVYSTPVIRYYRY